MERPEAADHSASDDGAVLMDADGASLRRAGGCTAHARTDWFITLRPSSLHSAARGQIVNGPRDLRHIVFRYQSCKFVRWMDEVAVHLRTAGGCSHQKPIIRRRSGAENSVETRKGDISAERFSNTMNIIFKIRHSTEEQILSP